MKSRMNWKRGLLRLWLLAAIPWMVYAFVEFDVAPKSWYAWRYYTDRSGLTKELHSPSEVALCIEVDTAVASITHEDTQNTAAPKPTGASDIQQFSHQDTQNIAPRAGAQSVNPAPEQFDTSADTDIDAYNARPETIKAKAQASALVDEYLSHTTAKDFQTSIVLNAGKNPDYEAETRRLEKELGLPPQAVATNIDQARIEQARKEVPRKIIFRCQNQVPTDPDMLWIIPLILIPTVGVAFAAFAVWLAFLTIRWAWRGFYS